MKKRRFKKVYIICQDKVILPSNVYFGNFSNYKDYADTICKQNQPESHKSWEDSEKTLPVYEVHGFYLVHESLFDEVLRDHTDQEEGDNFRLNHEY